MINMKKFSFLSVTLIASILLSSSIYAKNESSARALFIKGSGSSFSNNFKSSDESQSKKPQQEEQPVQTNKENPKQNNLPNNQAYIGLSAAVYQLNGSKYDLVNPTKIFNSGDRVRVKVTSNKSGYITVSAIAPDGSVSLISEQKVNAGSPITVPEKGNIKFEGQTGVEQLLFVLSTQPGVGKKIVNSEPVEPDNSFKNGCKESSSQRNLTLDNSSDNFFLMNNDGKCITDSGKSRNLVVENTDNIDYGVVPSEQFAKGNVLGLELYLNHQ
jgi:hypothetical protein